MYVSFLYCQIKIKEINQIISWNISSYRSQNNLLNEENGIYLSTYPSILWLNCQCVLMPMSLANEEVEEAQHQELMIFPQIL